MRLKALVCIALVSALGSTALAAEPAPVAPQAVRPLSAVELAQVKARIVMIDLQIKNLSRSRARSTPSMEANSLQFWAKFGARDPEASKPGGTTTFVNRDSSILPYGITPQSSQRLLPQRASASSRSRGLALYELSRERSALEALLPPSS